MTNKYRTKMDLRELYNVRDLPYEERLVFAPWGEGHIFLHRAPGESDQMEIHILRRGVLLLGP